jgi:hypothetical protein
MAARAEPPANAPARTRAYAFGLDLDSGFEIPGLPAGRAVEPLPTTQLDLTPASEIEARWADRDGERVLEEWIGDSDAPARTIDRDEDLGYRLYARHFGLAEITADGRRVACAPPDVSPWRWQRFLVGRILPWSSVLQGREVLHAGAVTLEDAAIAFVAPSGGGKTSLAVRLVLGGAGFLTDDVLALERRDDTLVAHPGTAIVAVRHAEREAITAADWPRLGKEMGTEEKTYVVVERDPRALPLRALYFLRPVDGADDPVIEHIAPEPRLLLSSTFVSGVQTPQRLQIQLDVCAVIAATVPTFTASVNPDAGAAALAEAVADHARTVLAGT